jgi:ABC-type Fe3+ transport system permease subunit
MDTIMSLVKGILIAVGALGVVLCILLLVISRLPRGNRARLLVSALAMRVGATALAGIVAVSVEPIAGLDVLYDIGAPLILLIYWLRFFPQAASILRNPPHDTEPSAPGHRMLHPPPGRR